MTYYHHFLLSKYHKMKPTNPVKPVEDDDEPDEWDQRILNTGCHEENLKLQLCHADSGDWRKCLNEMKAFKECWDANKNNERTSTVNN
ncbi:cytochrome oxidase assembly factor 4 [[Candida] anglica]|uniref:Cytochrome oxidase assembly factor 4 n=1 Tax=[Candida] anglica TaxID=148631 RepID=A0ABP0ECX5_9ASCO